jgi:hypothetical protein
MAVVSLKYKSKQGTLTAPGNVDPGAMIPIATTTLSTTTASITFSDIPQSYEHLQIRFTARCTGTTAADTDIKMQFNGDTASNYSQHYLYGSGTSAAAGGAANTAYAQGGDVVRGGITANVFAVGILDILDYTNTNKYKTSRVLTGFDANGSGFVWFDSGSWRNTNAITSILLTPFADSFAQYSHFALYGIKRAGA